MASLPPTFQAAQFAKANGDLELCRKNLVGPLADQVLIKVHVCGVCHSDVVAKYGLLGNSFPRVPGHEVIGQVVQVGSGVTRLKEGDMVGVGWLGGSCVNCRYCSRADYIVCPKGQVTGSSHDGGYGEYMVAQAHVCARVPAGLSAEQAAPLMCAGLTVFNGLRNVKGLRPGSLVAVQGLGGLGHLAVQFAAKMGHNVVVLTSGESKIAHAKKLGAKYVIDYKAQNATEELIKLGCADVIICLAPDEKAMAALLPAVAPRGTLLPLGVPQAPLPVNVGLIISKAVNVMGWPAGNPIDTEETFQFALDHGVRCLVELYPLEKAPEAFARMLSQQAEFRVVITMPAFQSK